jgi:hypothetical protein
MRRINEKLDKRWAQLPWPITWEKSVTQQRIWPGEKLPLPPTMNQYRRDGMRVWERIRTAALKKAKLNTTGLLYRIFMENRILHHQRITRLSKA